MTTPIAYITSMLRDPFADKGYLDQGGGVREYRWGYFQYETAFEKGLGTNGTVPVAAFVEAGKRGIRWFTYTRGPARHEFPHSETMDAAAGNNVRRPNYTDYIYDATNGTMSLGLIFRTNKGGN